MNSTDSINCPGCSKSLNPQGFIAHVKAHARRGEITNKLLNELIRAKKEGIFPPASNGRNLDVDVARMTPNMDVGSAFRPSSFVEAIKLIAQDPKTALEAILQELSQIDAEIEGLKIRRAPLESLHQSLHRSLGELAKT